MSYLSLEQLCCTIEIIGLDGPIRLTTEIHAVEVLGVAQGEFWILMSVQNLHLRWWAVLQGRMFY